MIARFCVGAMFLSIGVLYDRVHCATAAFTVLANTMPKFAAFALAVLHGHLRPSRHSGGRANGWSSWLP